jgi:uncharacterized membrane protein YoaK (UPF0700 family)
MRIAEIAAVTSRDRSILLLAVAGASVDAVTFLVFGVFTANQTGNMIVLAVALAQGKLATGLHSAISLVGFILGAALGELIVVGSRDSSPWPSAVGWALVAELVPLGCLFVGWHLVGPNPVDGAIFILVALGAIAMGIQSAAVLRLHAGATTTYVTGMVTTFLTEAIRWLHLVETAPSPATQDRSQISALAGRGPWLLGVTWIAYIVGAIVSGFLFVYIGEMALILPIVAILAVVAAEARRS